MTSRGSRKQRSLHTSRKMWSNEPARGDYEPRTPKEITTEVREEGPDLILRFPETDLKKLWNQEEIPTCEYLLNQINDKIYGIPVTNKGIIFGYRDLNGAFYRLLIVNTHASEHIRIHGNKDRRHPNHKVIVDLNNELDNLIEGKSGVSNLTCAGYVLDTHDAREVLSEIQGKYVAIQLPARPDQTIGDLCGKF